MNRVIHRCWLVLVCLVACAAPAAAGDWWDAMEAWSGPGPFRGYGNFFGTVCENIAKMDAYRKTLETWELALKEWEAKGKLVGQERPPRPARPFPYRIANEFPNDASLEKSLYGRPRTCAYLNLAFYRVGKDPVKGYDAVNLRAYDFGLLFEIRRGLEVGLGAGWIASESRGVHTTKLAITPIRVAIRPGCLFVDCNSTEKINQTAIHWARVLTFTAHERWLPQGVSSADFGAPEVNYSVDNEWLTSGGLLTADLGEMAAALYRMAKR